MTLCKKIKQNANINHIPVILLTAKGRPEEQVEGIEIGADSYLIKPFNIEVLKSTIGNLLSNRRLLKNKFSGAQEQSDKVQNIQLKSADEVLMNKIMKSSMKSVRAYPERRNASEQCRIKPRAPAS